MNIQLFSLQDPPNRNTGDPNFAVTDYPQNFEGHDSAKIIFSGVYPRVKRWAYNTKCDLTVLVLDGDGMFVVRDGEGEMRTNIKKWDIVPVPKNTYYRWEPAAKLEFFVTSSPVYDPVQHFETD